MHMMHLTDNLTHSTENLSLEQRYVLRNTHRAEPQGQENIDSQSGIPGNENKSNSQFLHGQTDSAPAVSSSSSQRQQNKSLSEARNPLFTGNSSNSNRNSLKEPPISNRSSMDVSSCSYNTLIIHNDDSIYGTAGAASLGLKKDRPSSLREQGVQEISEIPNDYLMESQVLKHLIANEKKISANKSRNFLNPNDRREGRASEAKTIKEKQKLNLIAEDSELLPFNTRCKSLPDLRVLKCQFFESGIVESLSKENTLLKQQLQVSGKKVAKTQQLEEEIIKIYRDHEELVQSCNRREKLEKLARMKLQENLAKVQALNRALQTKVDMLSNPAENQFIEPYWTEKEELKERNKRQEMELKATQTTLQEQRRHIAILDAALNNTQSQKRKLEEELNKKQMYIEHLLANANLRDDFNNTEISKDSNRSGSSCTSNDKKWQIDEITGRPIMRGLEANQNNFEDPTMTPNSSKLSLDKIQDTEKIIAEANHDKYLFIEERQCAQRKMNDLHSYIKNLESKVQEKEAFIRALKSQKKCSSYDSYNLPSDHGYGSHHLYTTPSSSSYSPALLSSPAYTDPTRGNENYPDQSTTSFNIVPNAYLAELSNTNYDPNLNFMLQNQDFNISTSSFDNKLVNVNEPSISKYETLQRRGLCCLPSLSNKIKQPLLSDEVSMLSTNNSDAFLQKLASIDKDRISDKEHPKSNNQPKNKNEEIIFLEKQGRSSQKNLGSGNLAQVTQNVGQNMTDISNIGIGSYKNTNTILLPPRPHYRKRTGEHTQGERQMATLRATLQETARLPWVNAAFFGLQMLLTCIALMVGDAGDVRAKNDTLLTPAAYTFSIWNAIYLLCMILLITDVSYAGLSLYDSAAKPNALRMCFAASCVANGSWCIALASGNVPVASGLVSLLWLTLLPLYVFASYERNVQTVLWHEYLCSELCVRLYFAWITVETVVSWTMTLQIKDGGFLQLSTYLTLLAVLLVAALSGLSHGRDPVLALVVTWALIGVTSKDVSSFDSQVFQDFEKVQVAATLGAGVLVAMVLVSCSYWVIEFNCKSKPLSPRPRRLSRLSQASAKDNEYGSIRLVAAA